MRKTLLMALLLASCQEAQVKKDINTSGLFSPAHERVYDLYSLKHNIGKDTIRNICHIYLKNNYPFEYCMITNTTEIDTLPANNRKDIDSLSKKYGLDVSNVTTLLLDYEYWLINKLE